MTQLIETRWTRYGKDRVYVKTADGADVGHVDLVARIVVANAPDYATELHDCLIRWTSTPEAARQEAEIEAPIPLATDRANSRGAAAGAGEHRTAGN